LVEPRRMGLEPDVADVATERRIGREGNLMPGCIQCTRERNHRMEMPVTDHAGEEDLHVSVPTSSRTIWSSITEIRTCCPISRGPLM
jgi:hypothetical protein